MPEFLSPWLLWFLAGVIIMLAELGIPGFVIIFFGVGCWAAALTAVWFPGALTAQIAVFMLVSLVSLLTLRKAAVRIFVGRSEGASDEDTGNVPVGAHVIVEQEILPGREGRVRFRGTLWSAVAEEPLAVGAEAQISGVDKANKACLRVVPVRQA
jgi:membrane protein implicated in regulation of membrane protease activity